MLGLLLLFLPFTLFTAVRTFGWVRNYTAARRYGLPIVLVPVSFRDIWWMPLRPLFSWVQHLPYGLGDWYTYTTMGWPTEDGTRALLKYGDNFVLCSPKDNTIVTAEAQVVEQVFATKMRLAYEGVEWQMPDEMRNLFTFFGPNVSSTLGDQWRRHKRITGSAFSDRTFEAVWNESISLTSRQAFTDLTADSPSLAKLRSNFDRLAMHILFIALFGQKAELTDILPGHRLSLMDSLGFILKNIMLTVMFQSLEVPDFILPKPIQRLKLSVKEFRLYMVESVLRHLKETRANSDSITGPKSSLLEAMISANEADKMEDTKLWLTDSELYGNIFLFNLAGYETTAGTFTFALSFLAAYPSAQDWVREEVDAYCGGSSEKEDLVDQPLQYAQTFPKLVRCLAVMYETLRLANHSPMFVKSPIASTTLQITPPRSLESKTIVVDPGTMVGFNGYGAHLHPDTWGADSEVFDPSRFVKTSPQTGEQVIVVPDNVLFLPWMAGLRACPAKKFSQVEFVGVLLALLHKWRIDVVASAGETEEQAQARLTKTLMTEKYFQVSTHLKRADKPGIRFVRRE